jgi:hypothetical protein
MAELSARDLRLMMDAWPKVLRVASDPWAKEFAASIWEKAGNPRWVPTGRQLHVMRAMLRQLSENEDDPNLIE